MSATATTTEPLSLVHRGWDHLRLQRPLAAWGCWQRALRLDPENRAAKEALDLVASSDHLPAAAKATYRFRPPLDDRRREVWNAAFAGRDMRDLEEAAVVFQEIADHDPIDAPSHYNHALCRAWVGENGVAIEALGRAIAIDAADHFDRAVEAACLSEILRQGAGAEDLAGEYSHSLTIRWLPEDGDPIAWLSGFAHLRVPPVLLDPTDGQPVSPETRVVEWLDRPMPPASSLLSGSELPRVKAVVVAGPKDVRFSSPNHWRFSSVKMEVHLALQGDPHPASSRRTPLPIPTMDMSAMMFRMPEGLDAETRARLTREAVECFYENEWPAHAFFHRGLRDGSTFALMNPNDPGARAKLEGVIRVREQLSARTHTFSLYGGYPFDRLRRRVGLTPRDPETVDADDVACMSCSELEQLDISALDPGRLLESFRSASALHAIMSSAGNRPAALEAALLQIADALLESSPLSLFPESSRRGMIEHDTLGSGNVRVRWVQQTLARTGLHRALDRLNQLVALDQELTGGRRRGSLELLRVELLHRADDRDAATRAVEKLFDQFSDDAELLLQAAAMLQQWNEFDTAKPLLRRALELSQSSGNRARQGLIRCYLSS
jgi:tetratricopeptide (TPR) repeat protein